MMNDLDICRRIAKIEGLLVSKDVKPKCGSVYANIYPNDCYGNYNPLTDDALCFQLMIKYSIDLIHELKGGEYKHHRYVAKRELPRVKHEIVSPDLTSPHRAICLAIIEANKGK